MWLQAASLQLGSEFLTDCAAVYKGRDAACLCGPWSWMQGADPLFKALLFPEVDKSVRSL